MSAGSGSAPELQVLHVDNHLLAVVKPACQPVVPDESGDESLLDTAKAWVKAEFQKPGAVFLGVVHRLDRPVSGVVLFARTSKAAARLTKQFQTRSVRKLYWGVSASSPLENEGRLEQWLEKDSAARRVHVRPAGAPGAKQAQTLWRARGKVAGGTWLEFEPLTGRSHQLRRAAASLGAPLLGDLKYGAQEPLADRSIALHARSLEVEHPTLRSMLKFEAPAPSAPWWGGVAER